MARGTGCRLAALAEGGGNSGSHHVCHVLCSATPALNFYFILVRAPRFSLPRAQATLGPVIYVGISTAHVWRHGGRNVN